MIRAVHPAEQKTLRRGTRFIVKRWLKSTSNRTFIVYPLMIALVEWLQLPGAERLRIEAWGLPLLAWGYLQYRLVGAYRTHLGGGGPGLSNPPQRLVTVGPYRYIRNPMYLGHLIFLLGLALTFHSWPGAALCVAHIFWFDQRARRDEASLQRQFGESYLQYLRSSRRWLPGLY
ncbi:MAG: isoprenylcysteine carboxylmethyltransferase family protein [Betaproteobacteria bacterium]|nr:isoprenylcysteine carboxylmethyltransferase family protein [Betaproteobacteria bacterium]